MTRPTRYIRPLGTIIVWPLVIFVIGLAGLVIALTGNGWRDAASWVALAAPVVAVMCAMRTRRF